MATSPARRSSALAEAVMAAVMAAAETAEEMAVVVEAKSTELAASEKEMSNAVMCLDKKVE